VRLSFRPEEQRRAPAEQRRRSTGDESATRPFVRDRGEAAQLQTVPWLRLALIGGSVLLALILLWSLLTMGRIHARGIVRSQIEALQAPGRITIGGLYVQPGDHVKAGSPLYVLISEEAQQEADRVQARIREEELLLQDLRTRLKQLADSPQVDDLRNVQAIRERHGALQRERDQLAVDYDTRSHRLIREIKLLQFQLAQRQAALTEAVAQSATIALLAKVDAATAADVAKQAERERAAREALAETRARLTQLEGELAALEKETGLDRTRLDEQLAALEKFQKELRDTVAAESERLQQTTASAITRSEARLEDLRQEYAHFKRQAGPNTIRASGDGVVMEVAATDGAEVGLGGDILVLAHTGEIWIDAYVPSEYAADIDPESAVRIDSLDGRSLDGSCSRSGALEMPVPAELQALDPGLTRATRLRIDLKPADHGLNPGNIVELVIVP
jgi:multidrug resistance efflux pump